MRPSRAHQCSECGRPIWGRACAPCVAKEADELAKLLERLRGDLAFGMLDPVAADAARTQCEYLSARLAALVDFC